VLMGMSGPKHGDTVNLNKVKNEVCIMLVLLITNLRHLVYCLRVMLVGCTRIGVGLVPIYQVPLVQHLLTMSKVMLETCRSL
jgi:hypothetical protein